MALELRKATKKNRKLRAALYGPSGAGKTFTALRVAAGMASVTGDRIGLIDSEHETASIYSDRFDFDTIDLREKTIDEYCEALRIMARAGIGVAIIDSMSHAWQELLAEIDALAKNKYRGNTWSAWNEGTPKQKQLIRAILEYPGHVIATMRAKTEWDSGKDDRGKAQITRVGLAPEQGKGIEYEFDMLCSINIDHTLYVEKDRTGKFQDRPFAKPGEDFGAKLARFLAGEAEDAMPAPARREPAPARAPAQAQEEDPEEGLSADWREVIRDAIAEAEDHHDGVPNEHQVKNHMVKAAVQDKVIPAKALLDKEAGKKTPERLAAAMNYLCNSQATWFKAELERYIGQAIGRAAGASEAERQAAANVQQRRAEGWHGKPFREAVDMIVGLLNRQFREETWPAAGGKDDPGDLIDRQAATDEVWEVLVEDGRIPAPEKAPELAKKTAQVEPHWIKDRRGVAGIIESYFAEKVEAEVAGLHRADEPRDEAERAGMAEEALAN